MSKKRLFRAWTGSEMVVFGLFETDSGYHLDKQMDMSELPIMDFIGVTDVKGNNIFEDDVMRGCFATEGGSSTKFKYFIFKVIWNEKTMGYTLDMPKNTGPYRVGPTLADSEIIGNIYENPDLI